MAEDPIGEEYAFENPVDGIGFAQLRHVATLDGQLSDGAYRTYAIYLKYAQQKPTCWPGIETVAKDRKKSTCSISRHNAELEELGYITRKKRTGKTTLTIIHNLTLNERLQALAQDELQKRDNCNNDMCKVAKMQSIKLQKCNPEEEQLEEESLKNNTSPPSAETSQPNIPIKEDPPFVKRPAAADPIKEKHRAGTRAALARFFETGGNNNFADTAAAGGKSDWDDCVRAFLEVTGQVKPEKTKASWARKFEQIGTEWEAGPAVMAAVIRKKPDSEIGWKSWTEPFSKGVQGDLSFLLGQHFNGGILPPKATGRAARSQLPDALEESRKRRIEVIDVEYAL